MLFRFTAIFSCSFDVSAMILVATEVSVITFNISCELSELFCIEADTPSIAIVDCCTTSTICSILFDKYSERLNTNYIVGKPWDFYKFLSVKVLKMNKNELVSNLDVNDLVKYFNANGPLQLGQEDIKNTTMLKTIGAKEMMQYEITAVLWIFLSELEKK